jgi:hypothetical protein
MGPSCTQVGFLIKVFKYGTNVGMKNALDIAS